MKTCRTSQTVLYRCLPAVGWLVAWVLLVIQGVAVAAPQCPSIEAQSVMESSMPDMADHSALQRETSVDTHSARCQHCRPHSQAHGCAGLHGCNAPLAVVIAAIVIPGFTRSSEILLPAAPSRLSTLAIAPPLRPPPA